MNGPDHYRRAARLVAEAEEDLDTGRRPGQVAARASLAQVHATLALAAATAADRLAGPLESWGGTTTSVRDSHEWEQATA